MNAELKPRKHKKCKSCDGFYVPWNTTQVVCSPLCARNYARSQTVKKLKREKRAGRVKLRTVSDWTKLAQAEFNRFIRERDAFLACISCGRSNDVKHNAGHYLSVGSHPELRFNEDNCHRQCEHCNGYKSGNAVAYRLGLIARLGQTAVESLEGPHEAMRYRIEELIGIRDAYRAKTKALKFQRENAASFA